MPNTRDKKIKRVLFHVPVAVLSLVASSQLACNDSTVPTEPKGSLVQALEGDGDDCGSLGCGEPIPPEEEIEMCSIEGGDLPGGEPSDEIDALQEEDTSSGCDDDQCAPPPPRKLHKRPRGYPLRVELKVYRVPTPGDSAEDIARNMTDTSSPVDGCGGFKGGCASYEFVGPWMSPKRNILVNPGPPVTLANDWNWIYFDDPDDGQLMGIERAYPIADEGEELVFRGLIHVRGMTDAQKNTLNLPENSKAKDFVETFSSLLFEHEVRHICELINNLPNLTGLVNEPAGILPSPPVINGVSGWSSEAGVKAATQAAFTKKMREAREAAFNDYKRPDKIEYGKRKKFRLEGTNIETQWIPPNEFAALNYDPCFDARQVVDLTFEESPIPVVDMVNQKKP